MPNNILLTGLPKSGKSTVFNKIINTIDRKSGFVTDERCENGNRLGFEVQTHLDHTQALTSMEINSEYKVGAYSVDLAGFENILPEVVIRRIEAPLIPALPGKGKTLGNRTIRTA
ncbi:MAG: hypothetical protein JEY99_21780 [Spirochaetales bacterium]|nr:hypothetical protein [Spirochaetales bacterium]